MKRIYLICLGLLIMGATNQLKAQWVSQNPGFSSATVVSSISAVDENVIWIAGTDNGQPSTQQYFARSLDGGISWTTFSIPSLTGYIPSGISAVNKDTAWVALYNNSGGGVVYRTNNGGAAWTQQTSATFTGPSGFPNFIHFFDKTNGVVMGDPNGGYFEIYTTTNGGQSWQRVPQQAIPASNPNEYGILDKFTSSGNNIWFPTNQGRIMRSHDKGVSWQYTPIVYLDDTAQAFWVTAKSSTQLIAGAYSSKYSRYLMGTSSDGGITWQTMSFAGSIGLYNKAIYVKLSNTNGYYLTVGGDVLLASYDDGASWQLHRAQLNNFDPNSVGGLATAGLGNVWVSGRYFNGTNTGLFKNKRADFDIVPMKVQVSNGKTSCFTNDSFQVVLLNAGSKKIKLDSLSALVEFNMSARLDGELFFNPLPQQIALATSGEIQPGETKVITGPGFNMALADWQVNARVLLNDGNAATRYNDTASFQSFTGVNKPGLTQSIIIPNNNVFKNSSATLTCSGPFTTIQWQSRIPSGQWVNETGPGSQSNNYTITGTQTKYFRAVLCGGTKITDSVVVNVPEVGARIGGTYYDNQTNASVSNRIDLTSGGNVSAVYTGSPDAGDNTYPNRGTFYNHKNGTAWGPDPTSRVESIRTGFGVVVVTKTNKEVIISHNAVTQQLVIERRTTAGTGPWSEQLDFAKGMWPRVACSSGDTIHVIALDTGITANAKLRYYRSPDAGLTWDIAVDLPGYDVANGFSYTTAETYAISAYNRVISIVAGGYTNKLMLWKSVNAGQAWTTRLIKDFPANFDGNSILPQTRTTDGSVSVVIDNNNNTHVFTGDMVLLDDVIGDNNFNYFPQTDGIMYWKETWPSDSLVTIATAEKANEMYGGYFGTQLNLVSTGRASYASASVNRATGRIYVTFTAPVTGSEWNGSITRRDVFGIMTPDGGNTWSDPQSLTNNARNGFDNIFPSTVNNSSDRVHILWEAGTVDDVTINNPSHFKSILHDAVRYPEFGSLSPAFKEFNAYCGGDSLIVNYRSVGDFGVIALQLSDANGSFANPLNLGTTTNKNGFDTIRVKLPDNLETSTGYRLRLATDNGNVFSSMLTPLSYSRKPNKPVITNTRPLVFCNGDSTILTLDTTQIGVHNHFWYIDGVERFELYNSLSVSVNTTSEIVVFAMNGGCMAFSDTVKTVKNNLQALFAQLTPDTLACSGSQLTLKAIVTSGTPTSYQWKKGGVNTGTNSPNLVLGTVNSSSAGKYTISINNQCGVYNSDTIDVTVNQAPVIDIQPANVSICDGSNAIFRIRATSLTPVTYQWKRGSTVVGNADSLIIFNAAVTDTGAYSCTVTNICGATNSLVAHLSLTEPLSINSVLTDTSICQGNDLTLTVNVTGSQLTYEWYRNTVQVGSAAELVLNNLTLADSGTYFLRITNSCGTLVSNNAKVTVIPAATATITKQGNTLIGHITGTPSSRQWLLNDAEIQGANDTFYNATADGEYKLRVGSGTCLSISDGFDFIFTGIDKVAAFDNLKVYPNPAAHILYVMPDRNMPAQLEIFDITGRNAKQSMNFSGNTQIDVSALEPGMYTIRITSAKGVSVVKVLIQR